MNGVTYKSHLSLRLDDVPKSEHRGLLKLFFCSLVGVGLAFAGIFGVTWWLS